MFLYYEDTIGYTFKTRAELFHTFLPHHSVPVIAAVTGGGKLQPRHAYIPPAKTYTSFPRLDAPKCCRQIC